MKLEDWLVPLAQERAPLDQVMIALISSKSRILHHNKTADDSLEATLQISSKQTPTFKLTSLAQAQRSGLNAVARLVQIRHGLDLMPL